MANIWNPQTSIPSSVNADHTLKAESQFTSAGQTLLTLSSFAYQPGTGTLLVFVNGILQVLGTDYTETSQSSITFVSPLNENDYVTVQGFVGISVTTVSLTGGIVWAGTADGTSGSIILTVSSVSSYVDGLTISFKALNNSSAGTVLINVNGLGARNLKDEVGGTAGISLVAGGIYTITYSGSFFYLQNSSLLAVAYDGSMLPSSLTQHGNSIYNLYKELDAGADSKVWVDLIEANTRNFDLYNDAVTNNSTWMKVSRTGYTAATVQFPLGKVGIGSTAVNPNWDYPVLQVGSTTALWEVTGGITYLTANELYDAGPKYVESGYATRFSFGAYTGNLSFYTAPSGLAGNAITYTERFRVANDGTVTVYGNTVLGDASTDTLTILPDNVTWSNNPTHSGNHTFSAGVAIGGLTVTGNATVNGTDLIHSSISPIQYAIETDQAVDYRNWRTAYIGGSAKFGIGSDAGAYNDWMAVTRTANTTAIVQFPMNKVGIGLTFANSGWTIPALQFNDAGAVCLSADNTFNFGQNAFFDGIWKYAVTGTSGLMQVNATSGDFSFFTAPSGLAGNAITYMEKFKIANDGTVTVYASTILGSASANYVTISGAATTAYPTILFTGADTNVHGKYNTKGVGGHYFYSGNSANPTFQIFSGGSNRWVYTGGSTALLGAEGGGSNEDLYLATKGTGKIRFQTSGVGVGGIDFGTGNSFTWPSSATHSGSHTWNVTGFNIYIASGTQRVEISTNAATNTEILSVYGASGADGSCRFFSQNQQLYHAANAAMKVAANTTNTRSINASGTFNANGSDYAEYEVLESVDIKFAKGDIVGFNSEGKLTDNFDSSISFGVKSTAPSFVGGDTWGLLIEDDYESIEDMDAEINKRRAYVDRIAYSGKVPCNVYNAEVGDFIIPTRTPDGKITGISVAAPTIAQYRVAVGRVRRILEDGRAEIKVM